MSASTRNSCLCEFWPAPRAWRCVAERWLRREEAVGSEDERINSLEAKMSKQFYCKLFHRFVG